MKTETYIVKVDIITTSDNIEIFTGWIEKVKGAVVQTESLPKVFTELGEQLRIIHELKSKKEQP